METRPLSNPLLASLLSSKVGCALMLAALTILPFQTAKSAQDDDLQPLSADSTLSGKLGALGIVISGEPGSSISMASGFLISACHVLTAGHVLARTGKSARVGMPVKFIPKGESGKESVAAVWGRVVAADADFVMTPGVPGIDLKVIARDWGLVELDQPLAGVEPIKLLYPGSRLAADAQLAIAGYPFGSRRSRLHAQEHCRNWVGHHGRTSLSGVIFADCAVRLGMSGGPLLLEGDDQPVAAGVIVKRVEFGQKVMTVAVGTRVFADAILAAMQDSEVCAAGSPFVWPHRHATNEEALPAGER